MSLLKDPGFLRPDKSTNNNSSEGKTIDDKQNEILKAEIKKKMSERGARNRVSEETEASASEVEKQEIKKLRGELQGQESRVVKLDDLRLNELHQSLGTAEDEFLNTQAYEDAYNSAVNRLLDENANGGGVVESHGTTADGRREIYSLDTEIEEFMKLLEENPLAASQFVRDAQLLAADMLFNVPTVSGDSVAGLVPNIAKFLESLPPELRTKETQNILKETAEQARSEREGKSEGNSPKSSPPKGQGIGHHYNKLGIDEMLREEGTLLPDNQTITGAADLLDNVRGLMVRAARLDRKDLKKFSFRKIWNGTEREQKVIEEMSEMARVASANAELLKLYKGRVLLQRNAGLNNMAQNARQLEKKGD